MAATIEQRQKEFFRFNEELSPFHNNQWQKGGMSSNGLRRAGEVINYFYGAGRQNIIPDPTSDADIKSDNPSFKEPVSSIGWLQNNGLGQVASGPSGPGTLQKSNVAVRSENIKNESQQGYMIQNEKKSQFVNYRVTDPSLVENLRQNPLSIYAVEKAKNAPIPAFFSYVQPDNFETYKTDPEVEISEYTKKLALDGSPNVNILGMAQQNPLMGITTGIVNDKAEFLGKTYGGNDDGEAKPYADSLYNQIWTTNYMDPVNASKENFGQTDQCKNKALSQFAQGYNVAPQLLEQKKIEWVEKGMHGVTNIPWGPKKVTGNPQTQQGGLWLRGGNPEPTMNTAFGYENSKKISLQGPFTVKVREENPYKYGLPGTLVPN